MSSRLKIGILGSKGTTLDLIEGLVAANRPDVEIAAVFTLNEESAARNRVAYFQPDSIREACKRIQVPLTTLRSYTLTHEDDLAAIAAADLDILCVLGWERLLPDAVLELPRHFACGMHGSSYGLPRGRGRSPMNWSLIMGQKHFSTSLFRYSSGTDDGDVIATRTFEINEHDTIQTLHMKNRIVMQGLLIEAFSAVSHGRLTLTPQPSVAPSYYPKRTPADGLIDWTATTQDIHRLVRALAPPYPPAFSRLDGHTVLIEDAQPFDVALFPVTARPGQVVDVSPSSGAFVVKTGDGSLLVRRHSGEGAPAVAVGACFDGEPNALTLDVLRARYGAEIGEDQWEVGSAWLGLRQGG